jgi:histidinol-phosphate aminotransferase
MHLPRLLDFSLDVTSIAKVVEEENPKCIFLTSPNNPDDRYIFVIHS